MGCRVGDDLVGGPEVEVPAGGFGGVPLHLVLRGDHVELPVENRGVRRVTELPRGNRRTEIPARLSRHRTQRTRRRRARRCHHSHSCGEKRARRQARACRDPAAAQLVNERGHEGSLSLCGGIRRLVEDAAKAVRRRSVGSPGRHRPWGPRPGSVRQYAGASQTDPVCPLQLCERSHQRPIVAAWACVSTPCIHFTTALPRCTPFELRVGHGSFDIAAQRHDREQRR